MFESILSGLTVLFSPAHFVMLLIGVLMGTAIGIIPGLGGSVGLAICLPFLIYIDAAGAIPLMVGLLGVVNTSDTITCILLAIPGTAGSVATIVDGHPMARKGEAARALSASFTASCFGGIFGAVILALSIPIMGPLIKQFGSPEFLMLTMLGLAAVSILSGRQPLKGLISAGIGLMLSAIGGAALTPYFRFSMGLPYLYDGIPLILIALGLFGVAEIIDLMARGLPIAGKFELGKGVLEGIKDVWRHKWLVIRCSFIGCYIGFVPGMGSSVACWVAYGHAVQSARGKGDFGKGDIRGVIGPEAANNASRGGEQITTLLFGVPGSGTMALMLMAFIMFDINPGPDMLTKHLDLVFEIVWSLVLASIIGTIICLFLAKYLARVATINIHILAPFVIIILVMGAFQATQHWGDLLVLFLLGSFGWVLKLYGYGRPPVLVGFVLGKLAERYLGLSIMRYDMEWIWRPWVIAIGLLVIFTIWSGMKWQKKEEKKEMDQLPIKDKSKGASLLADKVDKRVPWIKKISGSDIFTVIVLILIGLALFQSFTFPFAAAIYPVFACVIILLCCIASLTKKFLGLQTDGDVLDIESDGTEPNSEKMKKSLKGFIWFLVLYGLTALLGFKMGTLVFLFAYISMEARERWPMKLALTAGTLVVLVAFSRLLNVYWNIGLLGAWLQGSYPWLF